MSQQDQNYVAPQGELSMEFNAPSDYEKKERRTDIRLLDFGTNIGVVSGVVGLAGGMGGFLMPIMFGALVDMTGVRSSAFMLMFGIVWVSLIWMYWTEVRPLKISRHQQRQLSNQATVL